MSLINQMLKDLDARGGHDDVAGDVRPAREVHRSSRRGWAAALALLVVLLGAAVAYLATTERSVQGAVAPVDVSPSSGAHSAGSTPPGTEVPQQDVEPIVDAAAPEPVEVAAATRVTELPPATRGPAVVVEETTGSGEAEARVTDDDVAQESPAKSVAEDARTMIVRRHEPTEAEKARRAGVEGFAALRRNDWRTAARFLEELVVLEPANDEAREGLVVALANQGRMAEADGVLLDGLAAGAQPARFAKLRARFLVSQGKFEEALQSLAVAVPAIQNDPEFHALKGAIAQQAGEYALALQAYRRLVVFEPGNGTWQAGLAMALDQLGERSAALDAYRRALTAGGLEAALLEHVIRRAEALDK